MQWMRGLFFLVTGLFGLGLSPAYGQILSGSDAPMQLFADVIEREKNVIRLEGQVDVRQADVRVLANKMTLYSDAEGGALVSNISRIVAEGEFYYITPDQEVRGARGVYEKASNSFTITGGVIFLQGEYNVVTGSRLIYDLETKKARVIGTCTGRRCGKDGRVQVLLKAENDDSGS